MQTTTWTSCEAHRSLTSHRKYYLLIAVSTKLEMDNIIVIGRRRIIYMVPETESKLARTFSHASIC